MVADTNGAEPRDKWQELRNNKAVNEVIRNMLSKLEFPEVTTFHAARTQEGQQDFLKYFLSHDKQN